MKNNHVAIILAAGQGKRLKPLTNNIPKCLLKVGNKRIIEHIIDACNEAGIKDIIVVIGYKGEKVKRLLGSKVRYIWNRKYETTQTMYSLWLARKVAAGRPIVHINGDTYFHPLILKKLLDHPYPDAMGVDFDVKLDKEATKVFVQGNKVRDIGKDIPLDIASGECLGIRKYSARTTSRFFETLGKSVRKGQTAKYIFDIINECFKTQRFDAVSTDKLPWTEIDFEKDLKRARKMDSMPIALIFAAGVGRRIWPLTSDMPKALLRIGRETLIEHQIGNLEKAGIRDILVIVGHRKNAVKKILGNRVRYAENPIYKTTQTMYSLWQTKKLAQNKASIIIMGDLFFDKKLLTRLLKSKKKDCAVIDFESGLAAEVTKAKVVDGKVLRVGTSIPVSESVGEYLGLNKLSKKGTNKLFNICEKIIDDNINWKKTHIPFNIFVAMRPLYAVSAKGTVWAEIDLKKDFYNAKKIYRKLRSNQ